MRHSSRRRASLVLAVICFAMLACALSCAAGSSVRPDESNSSPAGGGTVIGGVGTSPIDLDGSIGAQAGPTIAITPANPVIDVTVSNGMVTQIAIMGGGTAITF